MSDTPTPKSVTVRRSIISGGGAAAAATPSRRPSTTIGRAGLSSRTLPRNFNLAAAAAEAAAMGDKAAAGVGSHGPGPSPTSAGGSSTGRALRKSRPSILSPGPNSHSSTAAPSASPTSSSQRDHTPTSSPTPVSPPVMPSASPSLGPKRPSTGSSSSSSHHAHTNRSLDFESSTTTREKAKSGWDSSTTVRARRSMGQTLPAQAFQDALKLQHQSSAESSAASSTSTSRRPSLAPSRHSGGGHFRERNLSDASDLPLPPAHLSRRDGASPRVSFGGVSTMGGSRSSTMSRQSLGALAAQAAAAAASDDPSDPTATAPRVPIAIAPSPVRPYDSSLYSSSESLASSDKGDKGENIRVCVRCRPFNKDDAARGAVGNRKSVACIGNTVQTVWKGEGKTFTYDAVFGEAATQKEVYQHAAGALVEQCLKGYNATVFAYGQTGSGKTHSIFGDFEAGSPNNGIVPNAIDHIFHYIHDQHSQPEVKIGDGSALALVGLSRPRYLVAVSFLEIYNEHVYDLLAFSGSKVSLDVREDVASGSFHVPNLSKHLITSREELVELIQRGTAERFTSATIMNEHSSRSHCMITIIIEKCQRRLDPSNPPPSDHDSNFFDHDYGDDEGSLIVQSKLNLVDLAGSERLTTSAFDTTGKETVSINQSLSTLANVIAALTNNNANAFIPYRDSKLTRLLKDSLGGSAKTCMISCINPVESSLPETVSTLRYASRAKKIVNKARIQEDPKDALMKAMRQQIDALQEQLDKQTKVARKMYELVADVHTAAGTMKDEHDASKEQDEKVEENKHSGPRLTISTQSPTSSASSTPSASPSAASGLTNSAPAVLSSISAPPSVTDPKFYDSFKSNVLDLQDSLFQLQENYALSRAKLDLLHDGGGAELLHESEAEAAQPQSNDVNVALTVNVTTSPPPLSSMPRASTPPSTADESSSATPPKHSRRVSALRSAAHSRHGSQGGGVHGSTSTELPWFKDHHSRLLDLQKRLEQIREDHQAQLAKLRRDHALKASKLEEAVQNAVRKELDAQRLNEGLETQLGAAKFREEKLLQCMEEYRKALQTRQQEHGVQQPSNEDAVDKKENGTSSSSDSRKAVKSPLSPTKSKNTSPSSADEAKSDSSSNDVPIEVHLSALRSLLRPALDVPRLRKTISERDEELKGLKDQVKSLKESLTTSQSKMDELSVMEKSLRKQLAEASHQHDLELASLRSTLTSQQASSDATPDSSLKDRQEELNRISRNHKEVLDAAIQELNHQHAAELNAAQMKHQQLAEKQREELDALTTRFDALQKERDTLASIMQHLESSASIAAACVAASTSSSSSSAAELARAFLTDGGANGFDDGFDDDAESSSPSAPNGISSNGNGNNKVDGSSSGLHGPRGWLRKTIVLQNCVLDITNELEELRRSKRVLATHAAQELKRMRHELILHQMHTEAMIHGIGGGGQRNSNAPVTSTVGSTMRMCMAPTHMQQQQAESSSIDHERREHTMYAAAFHAAQQQQQGKDPNNPSSSPLPSPTTGGRRRKESCVIQ